MGPTWRRLMDRNLAGDVQWALCILVGAALGVLVFEGAHASMLVGTAVGVSVVIVVLNIARARRRKPS